MTAAARNVTLDTAAFTFHPIAMDDAGILQDVLAEVDARLGGPTATINVDLQTAADTVTRVVHGLHGDASLYARFKVMAAVGEADFAALARLNRHAPALWFAAYRSRWEREAPSRALSPATAERGAALRDALLVVLGYHFGDDPTEGPRLAAVTRGNDHLALANQLRYLAELAIERAERLAGDRKHRPEDAREALAVSTEIRRALGAKELPDARWLDRCAVLWTLVQRDYAELTTVGRFLLRAQPEEARRRFPTLVKGGRPKRRAGDADDEGATDDDAPALDALKPAAPANDAPAAAPAAAPQGPAPAAQETAPAAPPKAPAPAKKTAAKSPRRR